jgi:hypothetical protein
MLREIKGRIRVITNTIPNSEVKLYSDVNGVCTFTSYLSGIVLDDLMIAVNNGC